LKRVRPGWEEIATDLHNHRQFGENNFCLSIGGVLKYGCGMAKRRNSRRRNGERDGFAEIVSPFQGLDEYERKAVFAQMVANARIEFESGLNNLQRAIRRASPLRILGDLGYNYFMSQDTPGTQTEWTVSQHHIEIAQALLLTVDPTEFCEIERPTVVLNEIIVLLKQTAQLYGRRENHLDQTDSTARTLDEVKSQIRSDTQAVRGQYHPQQMEYLMRAIFDQIDQSFMVQYGLTATDLFDATFGLLKILEGKLNQFGRATNYLRHSKRGAKAVSAFFKGFPEQIPNREHILELARQRLVPNEMMGYYLFEESWAYLPSAMTLNKADILAACPAGTDSKALQKALQFWSLPLGHLIGVDPEGLFLNNPVWTKPFLRVSEDELLWANPNNFFSNGFAMFESLIFANPKLKAAYSRARAKILEDEVVRMLRTHFPTASVHAKVKWKDSASGEPREHDAVVVIGNTVLIFEAKSGQVTPPAKRGGDERLKREIAKLMVDPSVQSERLGRLLESERKVHRFESADGPIEIDSRSIRAVGRINICFEIIGSLSSRWPQLVEAGLISSDTPQAPTMGISDLSVICELLENEPTLCHYFLRRGSFERTTDYHADEHDLIAYYLVTGFNDHAAEDGEKSLFIYGMSDELRPYYDRRVDGTRGKRPKPKRSKLWASWIDTLNERRPLDWLSMTHRLLNVDFASQIQVERQVEQKIREVRRSKQPVDGASISLQTGPAHRREVVIVCVAKAPDKNSRNELLQGHIDQAISESGATDYLLVVMNAAARDGSPYHLIAFSTSELTL
jgi:hypothetical protein